MGGPPRSEQGTATLSPASADLLRSGRSTMRYRLLADAVLIFHFGFVLFVVLGGLAVLRWPRLAWLHVPAAAWGSLIEFTGWLCPLTPLENALRTRGSGSAYEGSFIDHYVSQLLYPVSLS